ncbi:esterase family protein [Bacillus mangrovi]|uniref:Esterase family protein n=1 Tax=Metabacillus mangrovi TaxID=1491830 RepID=A0A7X2S5J8_9BACI|nr:esterase family protein [Metabacillus mangrovi]
MEKQTGVVKESSFFSESLNEELTVLTYLPKSYSPLYKYSLLIAQDGQDYFRLGRIARQYEALLEKEEAENVIIVGIPYKDVQDRRAKYHPDGEKFSAYKRFLAHELVPYLDNEYPVYQVGQGRALIGDSLAATIGLMTAFDYPNIFGKVIMQSPYVDDSVIEAAENFSSSPDITIFHQIGKKETEVKTTAGEVQNFLEPNRMLQKAIEKKGFPYLYEEFDGDHTWTHWQPLLPKALKAMFN